MIKFKSLVHCEGRSVSDNRVHIWPHTGSITARIVPIATGGNGKMTESAGQPNPTRNTNAEGAVFRVVYGGNRQFKYNPYLIPDF